MQHHAVCYKGICIVQKPAGSIFWDKMSGSAIYQATGSLTSPVPVTHHSGLKCQAVPFTRPLVPSYPLSQLHTILDWNVKQHHLPAHWFPHIPCPSYTPLWTEMLSSAIYQATGSFISPVPVTHHSGLKCQAAPFTRPLVPSHPLSQLHTCIWKELSLNLGRVPVILTVTFFTICLGLFRQA